MVNLNKINTVETLFTLQVKAAEGLLSFQIQSTIDQSRDFVATRVQQLTLLIYVHIKQIHLDLKDL